MFAIATLMALVQQVSGTPYISGGDTPAGTDCSGLASWVSNVATGRPAFGDRFHTGNQERALLARGFKYGTQPGALVIGWNSGHTAVTLPDGTSVSSGEGGGVKVGGGGAYQRQFNHHMYLPVEAQQAPVELPAPIDPFAPPPPPAPIDPMAAPAPIDPFAPPPPPPAPVDLMAAPAPVDPMAAPAPIDPFAPPPPAEAIPPVAPMEAPAPIVLDVPPPPAPPAPDAPAPIAI
ncbi:peptidoglycan endopeptidase [Mycolicibacterium sp. HK-90]|uniref:peptidoglycan endopeptidase n=1 Tax=Mycolicibacterium sp. HK-90 TaxID=3056937 RepID=UPI0034637588